ncbi:DUF6292 family protein [Amycolatopsis circi]|uniref:DUF6292 family protein n=1 Tax=Amycolatopsis circi TaxID=871959 RepID=UPI0031343A42
MLRDEVHGWAIAVETHSGEDLLVLRCLGGASVTPPPAELLGFITASRADDHCIRAARAACSPFRRRFRRTRHSAASSRCDLSPHSSGRPIDLVPGRVPPGHDAPAASRPGRARCSAARSSCDAGHCPLRMISVGNAMRPMALHESRSPRLSGGFA